MSSDIQFILERVAPGNLPSCFKLWACRGEGKGCKRNFYRNRKVHCDDCLETTGEQTMEQVKKRIERGDA